MRLLRLYQSRQCRSPPHQPSRIRSLGLCKLHQTKIDDDPGLASDLWQRSPPLTLTLKCTATTQRPTSSLTSAPNRLPLKINKIYLFTHKQRHSFLANILNTNVLHPLSNHPMLLLNNMQRNSSNNMRTNPLPHQLRIRLLIPHSRSMFISNENPSFL